VSGVIAYADPKSWNIADLQPFVEQVIASFGWDRVLFGSDWPVCTLSATLTRWVEALKSITNLAGELNQKKLFYDNAMRVYRLS
jgi:predicted TIM-barrel fold metal-dependent hydrolase